MNANQILVEMQQEFIATENLLNILPEEKLNYKPHEKAMSLGQLALHVAMIPGQNLQFAKDGEVETNVIVQHPIPTSKAAILQTFSNSKNQVKRLLAESDVNWLYNKWNLKRAGQSIAEMPTSAFIRTFVLNHFYHHRGQLTTYFRILGLKLPSVYGPSADVNPFA